MSGDVGIAYQVIGNEPRDLILVPGWVTNIEVNWDEPIVVQILRLASFSRLIIFDKRGKGLSDRLGGSPLTAVAQEIGVRLGQPQSPALGMPVGVESTTACAGVLNDGVTRSRCW